MALPALVLLRLETKVSVPLKLCDRADRTSFEKLPDSFVLISCFQIILNRVLAKTILKKKVLECLPPK